MKKIANILIVLGAGSIAFAVSYSTIIHSFTGKQTAIILFFTSIFILVGMLIHSILDKHKMVREKFYSRMIGMALYFTSITYYLVITLL